MSNYLDPSRLRRSMRLIERYDFCHGGGGEEGRVWGDKLIGMYPRYLCLLHAW